jgi:hypothetical protein
MLCGRFGGYKTKRMSRKCHVPFKDCGNPSFCCGLVNATEMDKLSATAGDPFEPVHGQFNAKGEPLNAQRQTREAHTKMRREALDKLHSMSQHRHTSAFLGIDFGANKHGIFGATPTDLMHAFLEGVIKYLVRIFVDPVKPKQKAVFDFWIDEVFGNLKSSERKNFL